MKIEKEVLKSLVNDNGAALNHVMKYYNLTKDLPIVKERSEEEYLDFLEYLIQDRLSENFQIQNKMDYSYSSKNLGYSISDALYNIYGEDAIPYLTEEYKKINEVRYQLR